MKYKYLATFVAFLPYITISASQDEHTNFAKRQSIMAEEHQLRLSLNAEQNSDRTKLRATFFVLKSKNAIWDSKNC